MSGIVVDEVPNGFLEAGRMRHDVAHRDRLAVARRNLEIEVGVDVRVEVDLALLDQLHDRGPGEQLGHRAGAEQRGFGRYRRALFDVGKADSPARVRTWPSLTTTTTAPAMSPRAMA